MLRSLTPRQVHFPTFDEANTISSTFEKLKLLQHKALVTVLEIYQWVNVAHTDGYTTLRSSSVNSSREFASMLGIYQQTYSLFK